MLSMLVFNDKSFFASVWGRLQQLFLSQTRHLEERSVLILFLINTVYKKNSLPLNHHRSRKKTPFYEGSALSVTENWFTVSWLITTIIHPLCLKIDILGEVGTSSKTDTIRELNYLTDPFGQYNLRLVRLLSQGCTPFCHPNVLILSLWFYESPLFILHALSIPLCLLVVHKGIMDYLCNAPVCN